MSLKMDVALDFDKGLLDRFKDAALQACENALEKVCIAAKAESEQKCPSGTGDDGGHLSNSIDYKIKKEADGVYAEYGSYKSYAAAVENGTRPHFPPVSPLIHWVQIKGIANGDAATQVAWAIAHHISKMGTRPQPFILPGAQYGASKWEGFLKAEIDKLKVSK